MHSMTFHHCSGKVRTVVRIPELTWFPTWICFCVSLMRLYIQLLWNYTAANCVRVMWESKETEQRTASKHAVIRRAEQISCTTWIEINLYLIYIWVPLLIWWGRRWMETPVLRPNTVSPLMNSKRGRGNSAGGEPGPSGHTRLLVTCLQFIFISTQCGLKWGECAFSCMFCKWPAAATHWGCCSRWMNWNTAEQLYTYLFPRPELLYRSQTWALYCTPDVSKWKCKELQVTKTWSKCCIVGSWTCFSFLMFHADQKCKTVPITSGQSPEYNLPLACFVKPTMIILQPS